MASLTVSLSEEEWAKALNIMAEAPFKVVAQLIQQMQRQLQMQIEQRQQEQPSNHTSNKLNGAAEVSAPGV